MISKKEIMQLSAGRDTDLLVAEQIMGWQIETDAPRLKKLNSFLAHDEGRAWWRNPEGDWHSDPPGYSSDIKDGWKIVEKMKSHGKSLCLSQNVNGNRIAFDKPNAIETDYIVERNLLLGICKAALLAII